MKNTLLGVLLGLLVLSSCGDAKRDKIGKTEVTIQTDYGKIVVRLYDDTPLHRDNFIKNVKAGAYDGIIWHRIVREGMIQSGDPELKADGKSAGTRRGSKWDYTIPAEIRYPKHFHRAGALAAARECDSINPQKRSSGTQFYIVTGKVYDAGTLAELHQMMNDADTLHSLPPFTALQKKVYTTRGGSPHLDGEYTVFGEVVEGMNVVQKIGRMRTDEKEHPLRNVLIRSVTVEE